MHCTCNIKKLKEQANKEEERELCFLFRIDYRKGYDVTTNRKDALCQILIGLQPHLCHSLLSGLPHELAFNAVYAMDTLRACP